MNTSRFVFHQDYCGKSREYFREDLGYSGKQAEMVVFLTGLLLIDNGGNELI